MERGRKIQLSKLAEMFTRHIVVGSRGLFGGIKITQRHSLLIDRDGRYPFVRIVMRIPSDTLESTSAVFSEAAILHVLNTRTPSQIFTTVIQAIEVFMVYIPSLLRIDDESMHSYASFLRVPHTLFRVKIRKPIPSTKPFKVSGIDERILPLCKWNQLVGWVKGLDYVVSLHAALHRCTSHALRFSLYLIIGGLLTVPAFSQVQPTPYVPIQFLDNNGKILSGGCLSTFVSNTSTPLASYSDSSGSTPNSNPVQLDSSGRALIFLQAQAYTLTLFAHGPTNNCSTSVGPQIWSVSGINPSANSILASDNVWSGSQIFNGPVTTNSTTTFNAGYTSNGPSIMTAGGSMAGSFSGSPTFSGTPDFSNGFNATNGVFSGQVFIAASGEPPLVVNSAFEVPNLNANFLEDCDWGSPCALGNVAPNTVHSTTFHADTSIQLASGPVTTAMQGTDTHILTAGAVSGTGNGLCTDANGGATTSGCPATSHISLGLLGTTSCTTGSSSYDTCTSVITISPAQPNTSYVPSCTGLSPSDPRALIQFSQPTSTTTITATVVTEGSVAVSFGDIRCTAINF